MKIIEKELNLFDKKLSECFLNKHTAISDDIKNFIFAKSKKLRPKLIFLFAKAISENITEEIYNLAICTELLHNSSLIHDDIVDNAQKRRGNLSLNQKLGNNLSVLAGDYTLAIAMQFLAKCKNIECLEIFSDSIKRMCKGEINQHFSLGQIPTIDEYIEKSQNKTAELFKAALISTCLLLGKETKIAEEFATNFGIAFQIRDDLLNILETDISKPALSDIHNRIFTAPVIFLEKKVENLSTEELINEAKSEKIKQKTIELIKKYATMAIASLDDIKDNQYKKELITLSKNLYKVF